MLGRDLAQFFSDRDSILWDKEELDITDKEAVAVKISELNPSIIINSAAYTDVDGCELNRKLATNVNGKAVGYLASATRKIGAILVHYSTDYVFDGKNPDGYKEDDKPGQPVNFYGRSKLLGEKLLKENCEMYYLIRTSWLFGRHGKNFVDTMLKLGRKEKKLRVVNDQRGKPTYSFDLAQKTRELIESQKPCGIYHITNTGETTWYDFAKEIFRQAGERDEVYNKVKVISCSSQEFSSPAKRPKYSTLINTKLPPGRLWQDALGGYLLDIK